MSGQGPTQNQNTNQTQQSQQSGQQNTSQDTTQQQSNQVAPWAPTQGLLQGLVNDLGGVNTSMTPGQAGALDTLQQGASQIPNFGPQVQGVANQFFNADKNNPMGILADSYNALKTGFGDYKSAYGDYAKGIQPAAGALGSYLDPSYLNPMNNPGLKDALDLVRSDVTNQIGGQAAAAGRYGSPAAEQAIARGVSQGQAPIIASQYNQNVAAQQNAANSLGGLLGNLFGGAGQLFGGAGALNNAGSNLSSGLSNLQQQYLGNQATGVGLLGALPNFYTAPGQAQLGAANAAYGLPLQNIGGVQQLATPLAGLGSQSQGYGTSNALGSSNFFGNSSGSGTGNALTNTSQPFGLQQGIGTGLGLLGLLGGI